jgi:predicted amidohydrolase YtcJ
LDFLHYLKSKGVTTVFDAGNFGLDAEIYKVVQRLDKQGELPVRYHGSYTLFLPEDLQHSVATLKKMRSDFSSEKVRIDTLKVFLDGVIENRTAYMLDDYEDTPGNNGNALINREQLHALILDLDKESLHLHLHTVGNKAVRMSLDAIEDAHKTLSRPPNIRIALSHLEVMDAADIARFEALGVIAQFTPHWHGGDEGYGYDQSIGDLQNSMYLTKSLVDTGAVVTFSSDAYFTSDWTDGNASPFAGIQVGHNRQYVEDGPAGSVAAPETEVLSREQMVDGYTRQAAYQLAIDDMLGSLETGKKADFIVLDKDLFEIDRYSIHEIQPDAVILDGRVVHGSLD